MDSQNLKGMEIIAERRRRMRILALAKCINSSWSDGCLISGECYLIEQHSDIGHKDTVIHQVNVLVYSIPDEEMKIENFDSFSMDAFVRATDDLSSRISMAPIFIGARNRFELVFLRGQLEAVIHRAKERKSYVDGSYRKEKR